MFRSDKLGKALVALAGIWAVGASLYFYFTPLSATVVTATNAGLGFVAEETAQTTSWYAVQGVWGSVVLLLFALYYLAAIPLARRGARVAVLVMSLIGLALSYVTGFSIGLLYVPAAVLLFAGGSWLHFTRPAPSPPKEDEAEGYQT